MQGPLRKHCDKNQKTPCISMRLIYSDIQLTKQYIELDMEAFHNYVQEFDKRFVLHQLAHYVNMLRFEMENVETKEGGVGQGGIGTGLGCAR